jgi:hypothetical protein
MSIASPARVRPDSAFGPEKKSRLRKKAQDTEFSDTNVEEREMMEKMKSAWLFRQRKKYH